MPARYYGTVPEAQDDPPPSSTIAVRPDTLIADVIFEPLPNTPGPTPYRPDAARVLYEEFGLPCCECEVAFHETFEQGVPCAGHDVAAVVSRLNACPPAHQPTEPRKEPNGL